jgi:hypothetical protein
MFFIIAARSAHANGIPQSSVSDYTRFISKRPGAELRFGT